VVSGDRDVYQVVGNGVRVMTTSRGITDTRVYDRQGVIERYGVPPELVTDLIGLKGDTSDNIPGVPGIGDKTAAQLLQEFGSLEEVLGNVDKVSGAKRKQNLTEHAEDAVVSKQLATLRFDIDTGLDLEELMQAEPDRSNLREFMREFELRAILERLEEGLPDGALVPGRKVEREIEVEAVQGSVADLAPGPVSLAIASGRASIGSWAPISTRLVTSRAKLSVSEPSTQPASTSASAIRMTGRLPIRSASLVITPSATAPASNPAVTSQEAAAGVTWSCLPMAGSSGMIPVWRSWRVNPR
jgi:hypothetical protein